MPTTVLIWGWLILLKGFLLPLLPPPLSSFSLFLLTSPPPFFSFRQRLCKHLWLFWNYVDQAGHQVTDPAFASQSTGIKVCAALPGSKALTSGHCLHTMLNYTHISANFNEWSSIFIHPEHCRDYSGLTCSSYNLTHLRRQRKICGTFSFLQPSLSHVAILCWCSKAFVRSFVWCSPGFSFLFSSCLQCPAWVKRCTIFCFHFLDFTMSS